MTPRSAIGTERLARASLTLACLALVTRSHAQGAPERDPMLAETLFQSGKELLAAGRPAEACPKLAESHRLDPAGGTVLLLGLCYEQGRQWASAWVAFSEAASLARKDSREDREKRARERIAAVEPRMSRLTLRPAPAARALPGLVIRRDGRDIPPAAWDTPLPVDPGPHTLEATAPGHLPWTTTLTIPEERSDRTVDVAALAPLPAAPASASASAPAAPPAPAAPTVDAPARRSPLHTAALVSGIAGVVGVGLGTYFGLRTLSQASDANDRCPEVDCSDRLAVDRSQDAARNARLSNLGFGVGLFALGGAAILYVVGRSPSSTPATAAASAWRLSPTTAVAPNGRPSQASLALEGRW